jgi:hypothetical protein
MFAGTPSAMGQSNDILGVKTLFNAFIANIFEIFLDMPNNLDLLYTKYGAFQFIKSYE